MLSVGRDSCCSLLWQSGCGRGISCIPAEYSLFLNHFCLSYTIKLPGLEAKTSLKQKRVSGNDLVLCLDGGKGVRQPEAEHPVSRREWGWGSLDDVLLVV